MTFEDFVKVYTRVNICDRTTTNDASLDVKEDDGPCGVVKGCCVGCAQFWCLCHGLRNLYGHQSTDKTLDAKEGCWSRWCRRSGKVGVAAASGGLGDPLLPDDGAEGNDDNV